MEKNYRLVILLILLVTTVLASGCATEKRKPFDTSNLYWPKKPDPTRVRFIGHVYGDLSVRAASKSEIVFGLQQGFSFRKPADVVVDKRGNAYTSELTGFVAVFNREEQTAKKLDLKGIITPLGLAYNAELDWMAVVSPMAQTIRIYQLPELQEKLVINSDSGVELINPVDAVIDSERGRIYVSDSKTSYIRVYDLEGKYQHDIGAPGDLVSPTFMDIDKDGNIYVVETFNFRFHVYTPDGETLTTIGEHATFVGGFARPKGIALDEDGLIYVSDAAFGNVQIFDLKGNVYLFFGSNGMYPGQFQIPEGMYIDSQNRLYVADQRNRRVQIFQIYSDKYYAEHPEEAAKFENPAVTIIPEKTEEETGKGEAAADTMETTSEGMGNESEDIGIDESGETSGEGMMEESQPAEGTQDIEQPAMEGEQPAAVGAPGEEVMEEAPAVMEETPSTEEVQTPEEPAMEEQQPSDDGSADAVMEEESQPTEETPVTGDPSLDGWEPAEEGEAPPQ